MGWVQARYLYVEAELSIFLQSAGFKKDKIVFIPCSGTLSINIYTSWLFSFLTLFFFIGYTGENLIESSSPALQSWYDGPTLISVLDSLDPPLRPVEKSFRLSVADFFKGGMHGGSGGISISGRIDSGMVFFLFIFRFNILIMIFETWFFFGYRIRPSR
jgi:elongation factor 1 alpha-like protein